MARVRPHPANTSFHWTDRAGPFRVVTPAQVHQFDAQGYFVLEDAFPLDLVRDVVAAIDPCEAQLTNALREMGGRMFIARADEITFTTHLVTRSPLLRRFVTHPLFLDLCHDLIGTDVRLYWDQAVYKKPGTEAPFPWHQDNGYTYVEPQQYLTCWVALTDATEDNGCPWVVPGLHRGGTYAHDLTDLGFVCLEDAPDAVAAPVRAGGIVVLSSLTPHATGPNRTDATRKSYIVQFAPDGAEVRAAAPGAMTGPCNDPDRQFPVLRNGAPVC